jgi:hypothetical protein
MGHDNAVWRTGDSGDGDGNKERSVRCRLIPLAIETRISTNLASAGLLGNNSTTVLASSPSGSHSLSKECGRVTSPNLTCRDFCERRYYGTRLQDGIIFNDAP